jgi:hypothetical protein
MISKPAGRSAWALVLSLAMACLGALVAEADVVNGSFEEPPLANAGDFNTAPISGWTAAGGNLGVWRLPHPTYFTVPAPDGNQIGYSNGVAIAQQLPDVLAPGLQIASVMAGRRDDTYAGSFDFEMWAGGTVANGVVTGGTLLDSAHFDHTLYSASTFHPLVLEYEADVEDPLLGQPLALRIVPTGGIQMNFDRVTLPEPSGFAATLLPAVVLGHLARRRRGSRGA